MSSLHPTHARTTGPMTNVPRVIPGPAGRFVAELVTGGHRDSNRIDTAKLSLNATTNTASGTTPTTTSFNGSGLFAGDPRKNISVNGQPRHHHMIPAQFRTESWLLMLADFGIPASFALPDSTLQLGPEDVPDQSQTSPSLMAPGYRKKLETILGCILPAELLEGCSNYALHLLSATTGLCEADESQSNESQSNGINATTTGEAKPFDFRSHLSKLERIVNLTVPADTNADTSKAKAIIERRMTFFDVNLKVVSRIESSAKIPSLACFVRAFRPCELDAYVLLGDAFGSGVACIHREALEAFRHCLVPGSLILLRNVSVFCSSPVERVINITAPNIVRIYPPSTPVPSLSSLSTSVVDSKEARKQPSPLPSPHSLRSGSLTETFDEELFSASESEDELLPGAAEALVRSDSSKQLSASHDLLLQTRRERSNSLRLQDHADSLGRKLVRTDSHTPATMAPVPTANQFVTRRTGLPTYATSGSSANPTLAVGLQSSNEPSPAPYRTQSLSTASHLDARIGGSSHATTPQGSSKSPYIATSTMSGSMQKPRTHAPFKPPYSGQSSSTSGGSTSDQDSRLTTTSSESTPPTTRMPQAPQRPDLRTGTVDEVKQRQPLDASTLQEKSRPSISQLYQSRRYTPQQPPPTSSQVISQTSSQPQRSPRPPASSEAFAAAAPTAAPAATAATAAKSGYTDLLTNIDDFWES